MKKGILILFVVMVLGLVVALMWNKVPIIQNTVHAVLDPTAGVLLNWNISFGMLVITAIITLIITLVQKYTIDQDTLRELKKEQKFLRDEMKKYKEHPQKVLELQSKNLELATKTMDLSMSSILYTALPIVLFFRWFSDYFIVNDVKIFGFFSWFWAYLILSIIFSIIFRKIFKLP